MRCLSLGGLLLCVLMMSAMVYAKVEQGAQKKAALTGGGSTGVARAVPINRAKIRAFLTKAKKEESLAAVRTAFKRARFNEPEMKELEKELKKANLKPKFERFKARALKGKKINKNKGSQGKKVDIEKLRKFTQSAQKTKLNRLNRSAKSIEKRLRRVSSDRMRARVNLPPSGRLVFPTTMIAPHAGPPRSNVKIDALRPATPTIGQDFTIQGRGFGSSEGEILMAVWPTVRRGDEHSVYRCRVQSWTDRTIVVTIPQAVESLLEIEGTAYYNMRLEANARILVNPQGDDLGSFVRTSVKLDDARVRPTIAEPFSQDIRPGQILIIQGTNLAFMGASSDVRLEVGRERFPLQTMPQEHFDSSYIEARVPHDIVGISHTSGRLIITNPLGLSTSRTVNFIPEQEIVEVVTNWMTEKCNVGATILNPLCFVGDVRDISTHSWELNNGWVVEDVWLETDKIGFNAGAYYLREPGTGSTAAGARIRIWADAYSKASTKEHLLLKGPKGTFEQSMRTWCRASNDCAGLTILDK